MKFTLEYPNEVPTAAAGFLAPEVITRLTALAEECGFAAVAFSDHPAPSVKWRQAGGHDTVDPVAALTYVAAVTERIRLMTNLYVLPFRNPYMVAKNLTSLDILSGGRLIAGIGAGYLRSEFSALGVDFDQRAALLDGGLDALVRIWTDPGDPVAGADFAATAPVSLNAPVQRPHPPIWIGGNSKAAQRRVVQYGQGWSPVIAPPSTASAVRTAVIDDHVAFARAVDNLHRVLRAADRDPATVDIQVNIPVVDFDSPGAVQQTLASVNEYRSLGATWAIVHIDASSVNVAADYLAAFSESVIRPR